MSQTNKPRILLVDDDQELTKLLSEFLGQEGFDLVVCNEVESAWLQLKQKSFDVLVLDVMLPGSSGLDVLRELRRTSSLPVIMLTALGEDMDRINGLELGADDYVAKPCNPLELVARLRALLRRVYRVPDEEIADFHVGTIQLLGMARKVYSNQKLVSLTATEFDLLVLLMREAGSIVNKERLAQSVLGRSLGPFDRSIDMHVSNLRRKLGNAADGISPITTIHGNGYLFRVLAAI